MWTLQRETPAVCSGARHARAVRGAEHRTVKPFAEISQCKERSGSQRSRRVSAWSQNLVRARVKGTRGLTESERRRHKILVDEEPRDMEQQLVGKRDDHRRLVRR